MKNLVARHINLVGATGELRTGMYDGREHLVVPVIALVEGVIHACNADAPELVRAEVFSVAPDAWNGEPVTWDHPQVDGHWLSANSPEVLARYCFGRIFNTRVGDKRLHVEAWLDRQRAEAIGEPALDVFRRLDAGELIEVSVGTFVVSEQRSGIWIGGEKYEGEWAAAYPDHIAMLPADAVGACSAEMGCGAPRVAMRVTSSGWEPVRQKALPDQDSNPKEGSMNHKHADLRTDREGVSDENLRSWLEDALRAAVGDVEYLWVEAIYDDTVIYCVQPEDGTRQLLERDYTLEAENETVTIGDEARPMRRKVEYEPEPAMARSAAGGNLMQRLFGALVWRPAQDDEGLSDADLREALWDALRAVEPGFDGIVEVFPDSSMVVYTAMPEDRMLWLTRTFAKEADGVSVNDDRQEVDVKTVYEPVAAAATECNCEGECVCASPRAATAATNGGNSMKLKERIAALIANERSPFSEADTPYLATLSEERIGELEEHVDSVSAAPENPDGEKEPDTEPEPDADTAPAQPATARAAADPNVVTMTREEHAEMKAALDERKARRAERKTALIASLEGKVDGHYTEAELQAMGLEELAKLAGALGADVQPEAADYSVRPLAGESDETDLSFLRAPDPYGLNRKPKEEVN